MSKKDEALKLALDALDCIYSPLHVREINKVGAAMSAIREALAEQPAQRCKYGNEPVSCTSSPMDCQCAIDAVFEQQAPIAYAVYHRMGGSKTLHWPEQHSEDGDHNEYQLVPLYASPQSSKPFVGLTDEEREQIRQRWATQNWMLYDIINAVDAKLREKNR